jgi:y4mF family transcriptional regulator
MINEPGNLVRHHRKMSGLSQAELAKRAGVGKTVIFDIEHGKESVQFDTMKKVLEALSIRINFQAPTLEEEEEELAKPAAPWPAPFD